MHSITTTSGFSDAKYFNRRTCSPIEGNLSLWIILSFPSASITRGAVPVVFAKVLRPPSRRPAAINRVTLDFPLVPLTCILRGIVFRDSW